MHGALNSLNVHYFTIFQLNMSCSPPHPPPPLLWILVIKQKLYHPISNSTRDHWHHSKRENIIKTFYLCVTWHLASSSGRRVGVLYHWKKEELTLHDGCVLWGNHVIIPQKLQSRLLGELYVGHLGDKSTRDRRFIWWPGLEKAIEETATHCEPCKTTIAMPISQ